MRQYNVLLVDDDEAVQASLSRSFRREPFRLFVASNGYQALDMLRSTRIDVLVSDEAMPGMLGTELLMAVHDEFPDVVPILLTGYDCLPLVRRALATGAAFRVLPKPCSADIILSAIREALGHRLLLGGSPELHGAAQDRRGTSAGAAEPNDIAEVPDDDVDLVELLAELRLLYGDVPDADGAPAASPAEDEAAAAASPDRVPGRALPSSG